MDQEILVDMLEARKKVHNEEWLQHLIEMICQAKSNMSLTSFGFWIYDNSELEPGGRRY